MSAAADIDESDDTRVPTSEKPAFDLADAVNQAVSSSSADAPPDDDPRARVERALACPCVADLRNSSCGARFDDALTCYMLADDAEKGKKCVEEFVALHACMTGHAREFAAFAEELEAHATVRGPADVRESRA
jgi:intermembrane space import and assembly protein 40